MEHPVWEILNKENYVDEFIPKIEQKYDFIKSLVNITGSCTSSKTGDTVLVMKEFFDMWNDYASETFFILDSLVNERKSR